ncbi:hypothetical protein FNAPI_12062 [Fusarium napiforme]|uniref:Uncharacterized protein n=1 Tax=Fusarium napiforme TaxID=42672 RepID=A0A8H5MN87_9HYPO|nr:hypothetical protein FNAPI_12062 [Fusarium napiforme]
MTESQIRPLSESHPEVYQRLLDQFDDSIRHLNNPIRVCRRSLDNILLRLRGNGMNDSIIRVELECRQYYLSLGGEDEHLHPFCYLECLSLEYRPIPGFEPRREHALWGAGGWPVEGTWLDALRRRILPELIDLSDEAAKEKRVGQLKHSPIASPWPFEYGCGIIPLHTAATELYLSDLEPVQSMKRPNSAAYATPVQLEELYSLYYIKFRKFSRGHNIGHKEAHREAVKRTSEQYWEWKGQYSSETVMILTPPGREEAIIACSEPTPDSESESEDGMDINEPESDDEDVAWSPVSGTSGQDGYDEPQELLQKSRKRRFDDDDDDEGTHDKTRKRARFTEPHLWLQKPKKRHFDDDGDQASYDESTKRARLYH